MHIPNIKFLVFDWFEGEKAFVFCFPRDDELCVEAFQVDRGYQEAVVDVNAEKFSFCDQVNAVPPDDTRNVDMSSYAKDSGLRGAWRDA